MGGFFCWRRAKVREAKTALKSGSSPLALSSFPKLPVAFAVSPQRLDGLSEGGRDGRWRGWNGAAVCAGARDENRFEKRFFSSRALLFP